MGNERIKDLNMTTTDCVIALSDGNPGAVSVMAMLLKDGAAIDPDSALGGMGNVFAFDTHGIYGPDIWVLFKDVCGQSIHRVCAIMRAVQLGFLNETKLKEAIHEGHRGSPSYLTPERIDEFYNKVCERLPRFTPDPATQPQGE